MITVLIFRHQAGHGGAARPAVGAGHLPDPAPDAGQEGGGHRPRGDPREQRRDGLRQAAGVCPGRGQGQPDTGRDDHPQSVQH